MKRKMKNNNDSIGANVRVRPVSWQALQAHQKSLENVHLRDLFAADPKRFEKFSIQVGGLLLDFSKQRITEEVLQKLCQLARECDIEAMRDALFSGFNLNTSEQRPALHTALRDPKKDPLLVDGVDIKPLISIALDKIENFSENLRAGKYLGASDQKITDVLSLGIGGSELGPKMVCRALQAFQTTDIKIHFVSNVDGQSLYTLLKKLNPHNTVCIINSKTFTTPETMTNANIVKNWFLDTFQNEKKAIKHLLAVTAYPHRAQSFGIPAEQIFEFWDWVGGRYSIWSAVGLPIAILLGASQFKAFLAGAYSMDEHFQKAPLASNMPVLLALLGIWNINFWDCDTHAVLPYEDGLIDFPAYLQQLEMESNGKMAGKEGGFLSYATAPVIWGGVGCNGQHAYMQLLHQGSMVIPADFLVGVQGNHPFVEQQKLLVASCFSQSKALMEGTLEVSEAIDSSEENLKKFAKFYPGNRPSNTILYKELTPFTLGSLIALYEHKVFVQGIIWGINSFDQWGVELGKTLIKNILPELEKEQHMINMDQSTEGLIAFYQQHQNLNHQ